MKTILFLIVAISAGLYVNKGYSENPEIIEKPVYLESRFSMKFPEHSRKIDVIFVGEMTSLEDCEARKGKYLKSMLKTCTECIYTTTECKLEIRNRYKKLFSNGKLHTTYLSLDKGNRFERSGRLVVWGLATDEAKIMCDTIQSHIDKKYTGTKQCI